MTVCWTQTKDILPKKKLVVGTQTNQYIIGYIKWEPWCVGDSWLKLGNIYSFIRKCWKKIPQETAWVAVRQEMMINDAWDLIIFPQNWKGSWQVNRTIVSSNCPTSMGPTFKGLIVWMPVGCIVHTLDQGQWPSGGLRGINFQMAAQSLPSLQGQVTSSAGAVTIISADQGIW